MIIILPAKQRRHHIYDFFYTVFPTVLSLLLFGIISVLAYNHETSHAWGCPVHILYGSKDDMTPWNTVQEYAHGQEAKVALAEGAGHWFHTPEELALLKKWEETEL